MAPQSDGSAALHPMAKHGLELFNAGEYFEAHEALESAWRAEPGSTRNLYQGILQVAVTYLHIQRGNYKGALKVSAHGWRKLDGLPEQCRGVDVASIRRDLAAVIEAVESLGPEHLNDFDQGLLKPVKYEY